MQGVMGLDFSGVVAGLVAGGLAPEQAEVAVGDMSALLDHLARNPSATLAMTEAADAALHIVIEDPKLLAQVSAAMGGVELYHDANAYGTAAFAEAWQVTRAAFAEHGVELVSNYKDAPRGACKGAAMCALAARQAAMCALSLRAA
jgi:hypothetical protein